MLLLWLWCSQWAREHAHMRYDDVILNRNWIIAGAPNRLGCLHVLMVKLSYFWLVDGLNTEVRYIQCGSLQSSWTVPLNAPPKKKTCMRALTALKSNLWIFFPQTVFTQTISFFWASKWKRSYASFLSVFTNHFDHVTNLPYVHAKYFMIKRIDRSLWNKTKWA